MLIQMPRGSSDQPGTQNAEECSAFEAALRRDLASAPVISYDAMLGGLSKRAFDFTLTLVALPVWLPVLLTAAAWSKIRHPAPVFLAHERVGYGGRVFKCFTLRLEPPSATIAHLHGPKEEKPANDWNSITSKAETRREKWRRAIERLPRLFNVLAGDMSLVGPSPLSQEDLEPMKVGKRYYLSARPGVVGISTIVDSDEEQASQYKIYAFSWSVMTDIVLLSDAMRGLRDRGELWRPTKIKRTRPIPGADDAPVRRRTSAVS
ncbi:MAG TPA: sugar transferase [Vitreimonas sp.]|nr:sugar transferase [Vitreimonas sp.]